MTQLLLSAALAILAPTTPAVAAAEVSLSERVGAAHRSASAAAPALAALRVRCGAVPETAVAGRARADMPDPVLASARFNIGSNAKSILASLAATFVEAGRLGWDTTVADVFGHEAGSLNPTLRQATLAQLLAHQAGLPAYTSGKEIERIHVQGVNATDRRLSFALQVLRGEPAYPPGFAHVYSNAGYVVAGAMLERTAGRRFEDLAQERLFGPLEMEAEFGTPTAPAPGQPWGHVSPAKVHVSPEPVIPDFLQPAGDVSLSMHDYGLYLREHLCGLNGEGTRALRPETLRYLHTVQGGGRTALGWGQFDSPAGPASTHVGGTGAFTAYVAVVPSQGVAVAAVVNSGSAEAGAAARQLLLEILADARRVNADPSK